MARRSAQRSATPPIRAMRRSPSGDPTPLLTVSATESCRLGSANAPEPPKPVWEKDRLWTFRDGPAKALLKRVVAVPAQPHTHTDEGTVGLALSFAGSGAHLRFWGERGLHEIPYRCIVPATVTTPGSVASWSATDGSPRATATSWPLPRSSDD